MNRVRMIAPALLLVLVGMVAGCNNDPTQGYTTRSPFDDRYKTVAVPIWHRGKDIYRRGLEFRLTEAIQKRIEQFSPMKVVPRERADTLLTGTIEKVEQSVLSYNPDSSMPREKEVRLIVSFSWVDLETGNEIVRRDRFRTPATYIPAGGFGETFFLGSQDAIDRAAERIVEQMEQTWGR